LRIFSRDFAVFLALELSLALHRIELIAMSLALPADFCDSGRFLRKNSVVYPTTIVYT
jgi:hypothetical protein